MNPTGNNGLAWHSTVGGTHRPETLGYKWNWPLFHLLSDLDRGLCTLGSAGYEVLLEGGGHFHQGTEKDPRNLPPIPRGPCAGGLAG